MHIKLALVAVVAGLVGWHIRRAQAHVLEGAARDRLARRLAGALSVGRGTNLWPPNRPGLALQSQICADGMRYLVVAQAVVVSRPVAHPQSCEPSHHVVLGGSRAKHATPCVPRG